MEKKKSPGAISLGGFVLGVAGIIVSMVGMHRLYYAGEILSMPTSLFLLYLGYAITVVGSVLWTLGVLKGWDDSADKKGCVGLRVFGALPFVTGIITVLGGVRDRSGRIISLVAGSDKEFMESKSFLLLLGAIIAVVGLVIWGIGFLKSNVKTTILLRGSCTRAKLLRDLKSELKKISWLSWRDTYKQSGIVLVTLIIFAVVIGVLDLLFNMILSDWVLNLLNK